MNTLVRTIQQPLDRETLQAFIKLANFIKYNHLFGKLFEELKNLNIASDIIGFISQSTILHLCTFKTPIEVILLSFNVLFMKGLRINSCKNN